VSGERAEKPDNFSGSTAGLPVNGEFRRAGHVLDGSLDLDLRLNRVVEQAIELLSADRGSIMLLDKTGGELCVRASRGLKEPAEFSVRLGEGISGWVAKQGTPLVLNDAVAEERFKGINSNIVSALAVPLRVEGRVIGVLNVSSSSKGRYYDHVDLEYLSSFADMAAAAIENAQLYQALRRDQEHLSKELRMASRIQRSPSSPPRCLALPYTWSPVSCPRQPWEAISSASSRSPAIRVSASIAVPRRRIAARI